MAGDQEQDGDGSPVGDLLERYRRAAVAYERTNDAYDRLTAAGRELVASRDAAAIAEWLCSERRLCSWIGPARRSGPFVLRGLVVRGGGPGTGIPADNAW